MIESEYYKKYRGPELVLAQIWTHESEKEKITDKLIWNSLQNFSNKSESLIKKYMTNYIL